MKNILLIFTIMTLSGCMASSLESQQPIYSAHSSKNVDVINRCLAPKWVELRSSSTSIPTESGYKIVASDDIFGALSIVHINKAPQGGSDINVYAVAKGWNDHWGSAARACI